LSSSVARMAYSRARRLSPLARRVLARLWLMSARVGCHGQGRQILLLGSRVLTEIKIDRPQGERALRRPGSRAHRFFQGLLGQIQFTLPDVELAQCVMGGGVIRTDVDGGLKGIGRIIVFPQGLKSSPHVVVGRRMIGLDVGHLPEGVC
jgi:hypothetical protein